jgi:hypothetical protein
VNARVWAEAAGFVLFLSFGFISLGYARFPADKTLWFAMTIVFGIVLFLEICFVSPYRHAQGLSAQIEAEKAKVIVLEDRIKPKMQISGGRSVDKCFVAALDAFYFRARIESLGIEHIYKVEAHITEIRKDGEVVELDEVAQLMLHPGVATLPVLKHKVAGFIDVVKTDKNDQPELALAWLYKSVDATLVSSGHTYEIDIAVSSESVSTQTCTFVFKWDGDPFTSEFEIKRRS